ncbi:MAG: hypothetical protein AAF752_12360 [Bacteroidota bacterium]
MDIIIRYRTHRQYGSEQRAVAAFRRRVPGHPDASYARILDLLVRIYDATVEAVERAPLCACTRREGAVFEQARAAVSAELAATFDDAGIHAGMFIDWIHYWHCLR